MKLSSPDGVTTVEYVRLSMVAKPHRDSDPPGDGEWLFIRQHGFAHRYVATVPELEAELETFGLSLSDMREVA